MKRAERSAHMTISVPETLKQEINRHHEINWSAVASRAFERQLKAQRILARFAEDVTEEEAIKRGLQIRHPEKLAKAA